MTSPIGQAVVDALNVVKATFRGFINERMAHRFADADAVRAADLADVVLIFVSPRFFVKDTSDTTSADDGSTVIRDTNGIAFKAVATGIAVASVEGAYSGATTYGLGALVSSSGLLFISRQAGNLNNTPDSGTPGDTSFWMLVPTISGPSVIGTSTTSLTIGTGGKVFATQQGVGWIVGSRVRAASAANTSNYMEGRVTAYAGTSLTVTIDHTGGSGTFADWNIGLAGDVGPAGADLGIPLRFNDGITDADPGAGKWGVNNATLSLATEIYISETDVNGASLVAELLAWDDSTTVSNKGIVELRKRDDSAAFVRYRILSGITDQGVYDKFTVEHLSSGGFLTDEDLCQVLFNQTGDAGADGGGAGDTVGPAGATDESFARFDTATGKLLQNGLVGADDNGNVKGANSLTSNEIAEPTTPANGVGIFFVGTDSKPKFKNDAGAVFDLSASTVDTGPIEQDMRLAFLRLARLVGDRLNMVDGHVDPFADEGDVDTATSTDETYDAAGDYYHNPGIGNVRITGGTPTTPNGGTPANINDDSSGTISTAPTINFAAVPDINNRIIGRLDYGSSQSINRVQVKGLRIASGVDLQDRMGLYTSDDAVSWTVAGAKFPLNTTGTDHTRDIAVTARYVAMIYDQVDLGVDIIIEDLNGFEAGAPPNMDIRSNSFTADVAPGTGRLSFQIAPQEAITINTDVRGYVSRDGGTTWALATLAAVETLADGTIVYEDSDIDLSGQPSGTSMKWRFEVANNKGVRFHGVVLQWA